MIVKRGEIYYADLNPIVGSEQGGLRPVLVIQNDVGNIHSPTVIVAAVTSKLQKAKLPTHISLRADECGLKRDSIIMAEQVRTIDKQRLRERIAVLSPQIMERVDAALKVSVGVLAFMMDQDEE